MTKYTKHFQGCKKPKVCPACGRKRIEVNLTDDGFWKINCKKCGKIYL